MKKDKSTLSVVVILAVTAIVGYLWDSPSHIEVEGAQVLESWIGAAIGAGTSMIGGAISAITSAVQAKKAKEASDRSQAYLDNWYNTEMASNILDRADTQSMLAEYRNAIDEQSRKYQNNAIKGGATEESRVAYQNSANKAYADAISKIAAQGQARKDQVSNAYMQGKMGYYDNLANQQMLAGQQMGNNISSAFGSTASALATADWSGLQKKKNGTTNDQ